jgi:hypothetical protein
MAGSYFNIGDTLTTYTNFFHGYREFYVLLVDGKSHYDVGHTCAYFSSLRYFLNTPAASTIDMFVKIVN